MAISIVDFVDFSESALISLAICPFFRYCVFANTQKQRRNDYGYESASDPAVPALRR